MKPPTHDAQGRRLSPHGAVLPAWYPDLATRVAVLTARQWKHTHTVDAGDGPRAVFLPGDDPGPAYTRAEWDADDGADFERREDGGWYFQGRPCLTVERHP